MTKTDAQINREIARRWARGRSRQVVSNRCCHPNVSHLALKQIKQEDDDEVKE